MVRALLVKCEKGKLRNITYYNYKPSEYWQLLICCTELVYMGVSIIETKLVAQLFKNKLQRTIQSMFWWVGAVPKISTLKSQPSLTCPVNLCSKLYRKRLKCTYRDNIYILLDNISPSLPVILTQNARPPQLCSVWLCTTYGGPRKEVDTATIACRVVRHAVALPHHTHTYFSNEQSLCFMQWRVWVGGELPVALRVAGYFKNGQVGWLAIFLLPLNETICWISSLSSTNDSAKYSSFFPIIRPLLRSFEI